MSEFGLLESPSRDLLGHLDELRRRMLVCVVAFVVGAILLWYQGNILLAVLEVPARGTVQEFIFTGPTEALATYFKVVFLAAFILSFPVFLYQLWAFVAPAMPRVSRRSVVAWFLFALVSFLAGITFAYCILLPSAFRFVVAFGEGIARPMISISQYISFAVAIIFLGGCVFEIPCLMGILTAAGILNTRLLRSSRRHTILIIFIAAAIITPTQDALNMILFAIPMVLLFEIGVVISAVIEGWRKNV